MTDRRRNDPGSDVSAGGPLSGIRVLDMSVAIQGPQASAYLADMGADVVKVEAPGGELNRYYRGPAFPHGMDVMGSQFVCMNRGKRAVSVDVHSELGREVLHRLAARSDVFVTNYRNEALVRMGMGYEELAALNPRLVWARASGFGQHGPEADKAMLDGAAQARGGLAAICGPPDGPPMPPGAAIADHGGAMQLALGIMTALFARERTGRGQQVNTSSLGAMMWLQSWEIAHSAMSGRAITRSGAHHPSILGPYGVYETKDGGAFLFAVAMADEAWDAFWVFVGQPEVVLDERWNTAAKRIGARGSEDGVAQIRERMRRAFGSKTTQEWSAFLASQPEIIYERVQGYDDLLEDVQVAANGYLTRVDVPGLGPTPLVANLVQLSDTPGPGPRRPPPRLGEHTAEVMAELGFSPAEISNVRDSLAGAAETVISQVTGS
jgi:crotonobetainyl-CoA:carnitine CoA-transferase CaiB-like acyl-CoA transferase